MVDWNIGFVPRLIGKFAYSPIHVTEPTFGVGKHDLPQILVLVA